MAETLHIRTARPGDQQALDRLFGQSYPALLKTAYPPSIMVTAVPLISRAKPELIVSGSYFVVTCADGAEEGCIVGAGGWTARERGTGRVGVSATGHVRHVVTDHRRVRQGIGRALMGHVIETARGAGMSRLDCLSTLNAEAFYRACGFETREPVTVPLRAGIDFPAIRMQRSL